MKLMEWDSNLAHQAQKWTDTCPEETSAYSYVYGENMIKFYDYNYSTPYDHAIDQWASARKYSDENKLIIPWNQFQVAATKQQYKKVSDERSWKIELIFEHSFTSNWYQMIWADADKVGTILMISKNEKNNQNFSRLVVE